MADLASIYQGGAPTQFGMQHQEYTTLYGKVRNGVQSITGKPQDGLPNAIKSRLVQDIEDLKGVNRKVIERHLDFIERTQGKVVSKYQDEWNQGKQALLAGSNSSLADTDVNAGSGRKIKVSNFTVSQ
jgi:hypothetical protein